MIILLLLTDQYSFFHSKMLKLIEKMNLSIKIIKLIIGIFLLFNLFLSLINFIVDFTVNFIIFIIIIAFNLRILFKFFQAHGLNNLNGKNLS